MKAKFFLLSLLASNTLHAEGVQQNPAYGISPPSVTAPSRQTVGSNPGKPATGGGTTSYIDDNGNLKIIERKSSDQPKPDVSTNNMMPPDASSAIVPTGPVQPGAVLPTGQQQESPAIRSVGQSAPQQLPSGLSPLPLPPQQPTAPTMPTQVPTGPSTQQPMPAQTVTNASAPTMPPGGQMAPVQNMPPYQASPQQVAPQVPQQALPQQQAPQMPHTMAPQNMPQTSPPAGTPMPAPTTSVPPATTTNTQLPSKMIGPSSRSTKMVPIMPAATSKQRQVVPQQITLPKPSISQTTVNP